MTFLSLRRLALGDLDDEMLRGLIGHGEDLFVERKRELPDSPKFGAAVSSFANTLGGWLLLGVDDDGTLHGYPTSDRLDLQTSLAERLRKETDPLPPFVAGAHELEGKQIVVLRVFESADSPHIVKGDGCVYVRTTKGKEPVDDHRTLLELARRGDEAGRHARERLNNLPLATQAVGAPVNLAYWLKGHRARDQDVYSVLALAAPLTVTPQFADWPISRRAADWLRSATERMLPDTAAAFHAPETRVEPEARGVVVTRLIQHPRTRFDRDEAVLVADSGGVVAGRLRRGKSGREVLALEALRMEDFEPLVAALADALKEAEAYGRSVWHVFVLLPDDVSVMDQRRAPESVTHIGGELTVPADDEEVATLARRLMREYARGAGFAAWEGS